MKLTERGSTQVLFGLLPSQTIDLSEAIWRVTRWVDPLPLSIDKDALRSALLSAIGPWSATGRDMGFRDELLRRRQIEIVGVNSERGVRVEPYPKQWRCKGCGRYGTDGRGRCACGSEHKAQLQFVAYHGCGRLDEPWVQKCPTHRSAWLRMPGTTTLSEIRVSCRDCNRDIGSGFTPRRCECNRQYGTPATGSMKITVHRAASVFTPRVTVLVNPPDAARAAAMREAGGDAKALEWVLDGMQTPQPTTQDRQTAAGMLAVMMRQGLSEEAARDYVRTMVERGQLTADAGGPEVHAPIEVLDESRRQAISMAYAAMAGRTRVEDMVAATTPPQRMLYETEYRSAMASARLQAVDLLPGFPVATVAYGFTRQDPMPGASDLITFRPNNQLTVYGSVNATEALLFRLDPLAVWNWMQQRQLITGVPPHDAREARTAVIENAVVPMATEDHPQEAGAAVLRLIHSYSHRVMRHLSALAGIERESLSEYLLPYHLGFIVYAAGRGEFVLGGLQAVFETSLHNLLDSVKHAEHRCALDPGCRSGGGACMACLHVGEPSCRAYNRYLDRSVLFGPRGYLS